jgi:hypothetical protein
MKMKQVKTPEYTRRAQDKYNAQFDIFTIKAPKGTKERMEAVGMTPADRVSAVLKEIERREQEHNVNGG